MSAEAKHVAARSKRARRATGSERRNADPCTMVVLGASGDLSRRKLMPALYQMAKDGLLPEPFQLLGVGRDSYDDAAFRKLMRAELAKSDEIEGVDDAVWERLQRADPLRVGRLLAGGHLRARSRIDWP